MHRDVRLLALDADSLVRLRNVAVADADPSEVIPPMEGPPGWTTERQRFFLDFFMPMLTAPDVTIYAIMVGSDMAGFIRLKVLDERTGETGIWLGRSHRGQGVATAAVGELLKAAARQGLTRVVADTLPANAAAQGLLRAHGARMHEAGGKIYAEMTIDPGYAPDLDK